MPSARRTSNENSKRKIQAVSKPKLLIVITSSVLTKSKKLFRNGLVNETHPYPWCVVNEGKEDIDLLGIP